MSRIICNEGDCHYACPGQALVFTCIINDSEIIAWSSDQYTGPSELLEFNKEDTPGSTKTSVVLNTIAVLESVSKTINGLLVIRSNLSIIVLQSIVSHNHSIVCTSIGTGARSIITLQLAGTCTLKSIPAW